MTDHIRLVPSGKPSLHGSTLEQIRTHLRHAQMCEARGGQGPDIYLSAAQLEVIAGVLERTNPDPPRETIRRLEAELGVRGTAAVFREALRLAREASASVGGPLDVYGRTEEPVRPAEEGQPCHVDILMAAYLNWLHEGDKNLRFDVQPFDAFQAGYLACLDRSTDA